MRKSISVKTYKSLIDYYITSLEKEDMFSISFKISDNNKKFIINPSEKETLFYENKDRIIIPRSAVPETFFEKRSSNQKQKKIFYGYPLVAYINEKISPLFFTELIIKEQDNYLVLIKETKTELNHVILTTFGFEIEEIYRLRLKLKEKTYEEQISAILEILRIPKANISSILDKKQLSFIQKPQILNKTILYKGERTGITRNLIRELRRLKKTSYDEIRSTSFRFFLGDKFKKNPKKTNIKQLLEIFPLNNSQQQAVKKALTTPFTVITGPPGTGKSQVVLNIIANAIYQNKSILFSSKNNKAVDVVREKLQPILKKPIIVRMGAEPHRKDAKEEMKKLFINIDKQDLSKNISEQIHKLKKTSNEISIINRNIQKMQDINNVIDEIQDKMYFIIKNLPVELYFIYKDEKFKKINRTLLESYPEYYNEKTGFLFKLIIKISPKKQMRKIKDLIETYIDELSPECRIYFEKTHTYTQENNRKILQFIITASQIFKIEENIKQLKKELEVFEPASRLQDKLNNLRNERIKTSRKVFDMYWSSKLYTTNSVDQEAIDKFISVSAQLGKYVDATNFKKLHSEWKNSIEKILKFLPVWVITNLSVRNSVPLENNLFDLLIIDEASQCDIASAFPLFFRAKNVVIIGDPKQLKHISLISEEQDKKIADENGITDLYNNYSYMKNSLYDLADKTSVANNDKPILLDEHYRCARNIITFSNEYFYEKLLHVLTDELRLKPMPEKLAHDILWHDVCGRTIRDESSYNIEEADCVVEILNRLTKNCGPGVSYGIVTFFRAQMELISQKIMSDENLKTMNITVGTSHRFQGDEKDVIIFSPAVSYGVKNCTLKWIHSTSQLLNVAITRAKTTVLIVGDRKTCLNAKGVLGELASYAQSEREDNSVLDSNYKKILYQELRKNKIRIIPGYLVRCRNNKRYKIDFALFINRSKYTIDIIDDLQDKNGSIDFNRYDDLRSEGWKIRYMKREDIINNLDGVIYGIMRFC